ncbi:uncharacterized protein LOC119575543 [Penaeus monodon]|uniref:uncharacterized protein LOC119575543 n=1 Tax=Penaeus monodon TaxID=6687 RepID=UPI0018A77F3E|nr:uncharacterized protein LOC119575543 [Penaeus monodon]
MPYACQQDLQVLSAEPYEEAYNKVIEEMMALPKIKNGKATGLDDIPVEVWKALGEGVDILHGLMKEIQERKAIPEKWRESTLIPIFKEKGDIQSCKNYRGIKLMNHTLKLLEKILDSRLRQVVRIGRQQIGFMKGIRTVDGILSPRQTMEKYQEKQRGLHIVFIDLEKTYNCNAKKSGEGIDTYPLLLNIVFDFITANIREEPSWSVSYADDIVPVAESRRVIERKLEEWRFALESRGMRISRSKTEYFTTDIDGDKLATIKLDRENLKRKSVRSVDRRVPIRLKSGVHKAVVRPTLTYGLEAAPLKKLEGKKSDVAEMKMLRWMMQQQYQSSVPPLLQESVGFQSQQRICTQACSALSTTRESYVSEAASDPTVGGKVSRFKERNSDDSLGISGTSSLGRGAQLLPGYPLQRVSLIAKKGAEPREIPCMLVCAGPGAYNEHLFLEEIPSWQLLS